MEEGAAELDIRAEIQTRVDEIEQIIKRYLPAEEGYQKTIMEAMNYSILAGGKRLRPMLMSETYRLFGGKSKVIEPFMAAMEMIHTYSLVHDDLPAMDNDEYRRGKKTTHAVYGEAMGILAGDALLNYAFETAAKAFDMEPLLCKCRGRHRGDCEIAPRVYERYVWRRRRNQQIHIGHRAKHQEALRRTDLSPSHLRILHQRERAAEDHGDQSLRHPECDGTARRYSREYAKQRPHPLGLSVCH